MCQQGLKVAVIEGHDIGGTCVNRGCVPSKALLAASGRVRDMKNAHHLKSIGITVLSRSDSMQFHTTCTACASQPACLNAHCLAVAYTMQVDNVTFERQPIADHANQLAANVQGNLKRSLEALGVVRPWHPNMTPVNAQSCCIYAEHAVSLLTCMMNELQRCARQDSCLNSSTCMSCE